MSSESNWLSAFPTMSTGMKIQMICKPPPLLSSTKLCEAILNLPNSERKNLIKKIPRNTLRSLVLSLPRETQESIFKALSNNESNNQKRDRALRKAVSIKIPQNNANEVVDYHPKHRYTSNRKIRHKLQRLTSANRNKTEAQFEFETVDAVSDYDEDHDLIFDVCSKHIHRAQFKHEEFLMTVIKMMRAFGDGPQPSRYSALIILNHIKSYLKSLIHHMEANQPKRKKRKRKMMKSKELDVLEKWFPKQVKVFKKWKYFKFEAKKHDNKAPDLANDNEDSDSDEGENADYMENIRRNKSEYTIFVDDLDIDIGYGSRLVECDRFTATMDKRQYFKFAKCREASLTSQKKKFYHWLRIEPYSKIKTYFLGFVTWDRIGCIIQIARRLDNCGYGVIMEKEKFLEPTQIVKAILRINGLNAITPFTFVDHSLDKIDLTEIDENEFEMDDNETVSGKKRKLTEIGNDSNEDGMNPPKKLKLK